jgi:hypothetical protein
MKTCPIAAGEAALGFRGVPVPAERSGLRSCNFRLALGCRAQRIHWRVADRLASARAEEQAAGAAHGLHGARTRSRTWTIFSLVFTRDARVMQTRIPPR